MIVGKIPPRDRLDRRMAVEQAIDRFSIAQLRTLAFGRGRPVGAHRMPVAVIGVLGTARKHRQLGVVQGQPKAGILLADVPRFPQRPRTGVHVALDADRRHGSAALNEVADQLVTRRIAHVKVVIEELCVRVCLVRQAQQLVDGRRRLPSDGASYGVVVPMADRRFIDHVPRVDQPAKAADDVADPLPQQAEHLFVGQRSSPPGIHFVPDQWMSLGGNVLFLAPGRHLSQRFVARDAPGCLIGAPVKGQRGIVQQGVKAFLVPLAQLRISQGRQLKAVAPKSERMAGQRHGDLGPR